MNEEENTPNNNSIRADRATPSPLNEITLIRDAIEQGKDVHLKDVELLFREYDSQISRAEYWQQRATPSLGDAVDEAGKVGQLMNAADQSGYKRGVATAIQAVESVTIRSTPTLMAKWRQLSDTPKHSSKSAGVPA